MIYFDTDVLIHYFVAYDLTKHQQAQRLVSQALNDSVFYVSLLSVQETTYVMAKLKQTNQSIQEAVDIMLATSPVNYDMSMFRRASNLAFDLGFLNINDCLHTAIAEAQNCTELITYNRKDFSRIQSLTSLKITILASKE
ncbi:PIN domain-containing protein [Spirosoma sp. SC4-14]|uniref:type II toxin-antitoxin system VapC family toxin n=1 Tax=Spirosoma sp. SC4-14 TaxID=3128900 RepID=UPI0030D55EF0